jgi:hypothetical protein
MSTTSDPHETPTAHRTIGSVNGGAMKASKKDIRETTIRERQAASRR